VRQRFREGGIFRGVGASMSFVSRRLPKTAVNAGLVLALIIPLSLGGSAFAKKRPAVSTVQTRSAPACFDSCFNQCLSIGGSGGSCSRTCHARCSGILGDIENRF
jgi:hypothetical protein